LIGNTITTTWCVSCYVTTPFESILNGPAETGVTFVLVGLTKTVFKVSLSVTLNHYFGFTLCFTANGLSSTASIGFKQLLLQ
jgi:hypothetical protein